MVDAAQTVGRRCKTVCARKVKKRHKRSRRRARGDTTGRGDDDRDAGDDDDGDGLSSDRSDDRSDRNDDGNGCDAGGGAPLGDNSKQRAIRTLSRASGDGGSDEEDAATAARRHRDGRQL